MNLDMSRDHDIRMKDVNINRAAGALWENIRVLDDNVDIRRHRLFCLNDRTEQTALKII